MEEIIANLKIACQKIAHLIQNTPPNSLSQEHSITNNSNEIVKYLDLQTNNILKNHLSSLPQVYSISSEEEATELITNPNGKYMVAFDPLDGSSNIDCNAPIGTIFGIYTKLPYNQPAKNHIVASGYCLYSNSTQFVSTHQMHHGIKIEQLIDNKWVTTNENHYIPKKGKYYSANLANQAKWDPTVTSIVYYLNNRKYGLRYIGSLVGDGHRTIVKGGVFMYPADTSNPNGKLRQYYEVVPFSYLFEKGGGVALNSEFSHILDEEMNEDMHYRRPLVLSSSQDLPAH